ncbi:hypothetical protein OG874_21955 [Nocardia sp. NBC_00565]|uniref:hypothetical protein n=1 Tax=Nocardia sp. NBC_00565 TaxID=2975993 RepID=UPI002E8158BE|nr:hypothetical protein [Nocardia sp. NBC_00565]WUC07583.1 hypothetical protein OG874_21955 [Nocardia sp. NBC_00565]
MNQSTNESARKRLEVLAGEWTMQAGPPGGPPWPGAGRVTFEWLRGTPLLVQRWHIDLPDAPDGVAVIGCDGMSDTYYQLYTDDRDVQRIYEMTLTDGIWTLQRDGEPFAQRFTGRFSDDGKTIRGRWELAEDQRTWKTDFDLTYTKLA